MPSGPGAELHRLGRALQEAGALDEAAAAYRRAIELEPDPAYFLALGDVRRYEPGDPYVTALEGMAQNIDALDAYGQIDLHFALGKAYDDVGEHRRAFEHLLAGNALRRPTENYDEAGTLASFRNIREVFSRETMAAMRGHGDPSPVPLFIIGMPRSGSTLVEQILAAHPTVHGAGELLFFDEAVGEIFPGAGAPLTPERLRELGGLYVRRLHALSPASQRITDKMPSNVKFAGLISLALPNARIFATQRDPLDTCISCFAQLFTDQPQTFDLGELGRYYRGQAELMEHWRAVLPAGTVLDVQYEEVVADLETQARRIVAHAGLPWNDACLAFHETKRPIKTASSAQVRQPIYQSSIGRARPYADLLKPLIEALDG